MRVCGGGDGVFYYLTRNMVCSMFTWNVNFSFEYICTKDTNWFCLRHRQSWSVLGRVQSKFWLT